jgi:ketosteroid isomerase-like protein
MMTKFFSRSGIGVRLAGAFVVCAAAGLARAADPAATVEAAVRKLETQRAEAMLKGDVASLGKILADDLTYLHGSGVLDTKETLLASIASGKMKYVAFDESDLKVRVYGGAAVLTGRVAVKAQRGDELLDFKLGLTGVYAKGGDGAWRLVAWQTTRLGS